MLQVVGLLCFTCFCDDFQIPDMAHMPAKEPLLCLFITSHGAGCVGNERGTGNTVCFWPGVHWGTGAVLRFDTRTLTITSRGFYVVFGHTPYGVRNFISYPLGGRGALRTHCLC